MNDREVSSVDAAETRTTGQLMDDLSDQVKRLIRDEMRLAALEVRRKGIKSGVGAGLMGVAGVLAMLGATALVAGAVLALAFVVPAWLSALIVGGGLLVVAGLAGLVGTKQIKSGTPPVPDEAVSGVRDDIEAVKEGARS